MRYVRPHLSMFALYHVPGDVGRRRYIIVEPTALSLGEWSEWAGSILEHAGLRMPPGACYMPPGNRRQCLTS